MKKHNVLIVGLFALVFILSFVFVGCNQKSDKIYCYDYTGTYKTELLLNVKNHSRLDPSDGKQAFYYNGDLKTLCDDINNKNHLSTTIINNQIILDIKTKSSLYSYVIYKDNEQPKNAPKNHSRYIIYSMGYWLKNGDILKQVYFPEYLLDKKIDSTKDMKEITYTCTLTIDELSKYYNMRGYKTEINDNILSVVSLKIYPNKFLSDYKTLGLKIKYVSENQLLFLDFINEYNF